MRNQKVDQLGTLLKRPSFTTKEARDRGVHPSLISYYAKQGLLEKLSRGVYRGKDETRRAIPFEWEDLISTATSISNGRICLLSALALYQLTDQIPRQFWIAVPHETRAPKRPQAKIVRMRDIKTGAARIKLGEVSVKIFDPERTIIDAFRYLSKEIAIKALKQYLSGKNGKPNLSKINKYAERLRVPIRMYLEALTT